MEIRHKEFEQEQQHLQETIEIVRQSIELADQEKVFLREDTLEAFMDLDFLDSAHTYDRVALNATLLKSLINNYDGLLRAKEKPYFCRINLQQTGTDEINALFIGKMALHAPRVGSKQEVVDWRAPVSSVYYDGRLGEVSYETPEGMAKGILHLKRQYGIEAGILKQIMDVDITTNDDFLQAALGESKDNKLKDIVSTIQQEQNAIIRAPLEQPLIVQGVAGSGKTTIALHRISYLIYTYEDRFHPRDFLIIAPNRIFLDYISNVLPELGAERVRQTTFLDLAVSYIKLKTKITEPNEMLKCLIHPDVMEYEKAKLRKITQWKGSLSFLKTLAQYVEQIKQEMVPDADFSIEGHTIVSRSEIWEMIASSAYQSSLSARVTSVKKVLSSRLKKQMNLLLDNIEVEFDQKKEKTRQDLCDVVERKKAMICLIDECQEAKERFKKASKSAVKEYMAKYQKLDTLAAYHRLLRNSDILMQHSNAMSNEFAQDIVLYCSSIFDEKRLEQEDLAPMMYLNYQLHGADGLNARYVVVDEAQDFSPLQMSVLKELMGTKLFTILGDLSQGIHEYRGIKDWNALVNEVFGEDNCQYRELRQSYRTTIDIMDLANQVLSKCKESSVLLAEPVVRHGSAPSIHRQKNHETLIENILVHINHLRKEGRKSIAIVGKSILDCNLLYKEVVKVDEHITLLQENAENYHGGTLIVPSYLAKGLEFDSVIVTAIQEDFLMNDLDIKLLYVAMTRAMHTLDIFCLDNKLDLLNEL